MSRHGLSIATLSLAITFATIASAQGTTPPAQSAASPGPPPPAQTTAAERAPASITALEDNHRLRVAALTAQAQAAVSNSNARAAAAEAATSENVVNSARAGKLIRYGVTIGLAVVGQSRSTNGTDGAQQKSFNVTTMPYLAIYPGYWFMNEYQRTYCASAYVADDASAAASSTFELAKKMARLRLDYNTRLNLSSSDEQTRRAAEARVEDLAREKFNPGNLPGCTATWVGLYAGKPTAYTATVEPVNGEETINREVRPTASFGLALQPNAYVSILAGVTHSSITVPLDGGGETSRRFLHFTLGVGGNFDLIGSVFR